MEGQSAETLVVIVVLVGFGWSCLGRKPAGETGRDFLKSTVARLFARVKPA